MTSWWWRVRADRATERRFRLIQRSPQPIDVRGPRRWRSVTEDWMPWLRRSPVAVELLTRYREADEYLYLLGYEAYRDQMVDVLSRSAPPDCAAAGLGCSRGTRGCREPAACAREPGTATCRTFHSSWGDHLSFWARFSPGAGHRAVVWRDTRDLERETLWIDGRPAGGQHHLDPHGDWIDDRFFVALAAGPDDHPAQDHVWDQPVTKINSVLICDADESTEQLLTPRPEEMWTRPTVVRDGSALLVFPDRAAAGTGAPPDRTLPVT